MVVAGVVVAALSYSKLPFFNNSRDYSAYFAEAGGLLTGTAVQVSGFKAGKVDSIDLDGPRVLVKFEVDKTHPARRSHRGGDQDQEPAGRQDPGSHTAR